MAHSLPVKKLKPGFVKVFFLAFSLKGLLIHLIITQVINHYYTIIFQIIPLRIYLQCLDVVYVLAPDDLMDGLYSMWLQYQYAPVQCYVVV